MIELPHLTMHLRRIGRRRALRTLLIILVWVLFICLRLALCEYGAWGDYYPVWLPDIGSLGMLVGYFIIYWVIASQTTSLLYDERGRPADWLGATVGNGAVLGGVLAVTGLSTLVPLGMLLLYAAFDPEAGLNGDELAAVNIALAVLRLGNFALAMGSLHIVARATPLHRFLPLPMALAATAAHHWDIGYAFVLLEMVNNAQTNYTYIRSGPVITEPAAGLLWLAACIAFSLTVLALLPRLLKYLINRQQPGPVHYLLLLASLGIPFIYGVAGFIHEHYFSSHVKQGINLANIMGGIYQTPVHALASCSLPGIQPLVNTGPYFGYYHALDVSDYVCYGAFQAGYQDAVLFVALFYIAMLGLWIRTALACLQALRYPRLR